MCYTDEPVIAWCTTAEPVIFVTMLIDASISKSQVNIMTVPRTQTVRVFSDKVLEVSLPRLIILFRNFVMSTHAFSHLDTRTVLGVRTDYIVQ